MSDIDWDQFSSGGTFIKFDTKGVTVTGTITAMRVGTNYNQDGSVIILDLDTADGLRSVSCGQANLRAQITALRPSVGDDITITYTKDEKAALGTKKIFTIKHDTGAKAPF